MLGRFSSFLTLMTCSISASHLLADSWERTRKELLDIGRRAETIAKIEENNNQNSGRLLLDIYRDGRELFDQGEYTSAGMVFEEFLKLTQVPHHEFQRDAWFWAGMSFKKTRDAAKGLNYLLNYLRAFPSSKTPNYDQLFKALEAIFAIRIDGRYGSKTASSLSGIASLKIPSQYRDRFYLILAKNAAKIGRIDLAMLWLERTDTDAVLGGWEQVYYRAVVLSAKGDFEQAKQHAQKSILLARNKSQRSKSNLVLARIFLKLSDLPSAISQYQRVGVKHGSYKEALEEMIFVEMSLERYRQALTSARIWQQKFGGSDSGDIGRLIGYLELKSGFEKEGNAHLKSEIKKLQDLYSWINLHTREDQSLEYDRLKDLKLRSNGLVDTPEILHRFFLLDAEFIKLNDEISRSRSKSAQIIRVLGRGGIASLWPSLHESITNLSELSAEFFRMGSSIDSLLEAHTKYMIRGSEIVDIQHFRKKLELSKLPHFHLNRSRNQGANWLEFDRSSRELLQENEHLIRLNAKVAGLKFNGSQIEAKIANADLQRLQGRVLSLVKKVRKQNLAKMGSQSELKWHFGNFGLKATVYYDLLDTYKRIFERKQNVTSILELNDFENLMESWRVASLKFFQSYKAFDKSYNQYLSHIIRTDTELDREANRSLKKLQIARQKTLDLISRNRLVWRVDLLEKIETSINTMSAWLGDHEWQSFKSRQDEVSEIKRRSEVASRASKSDLDLFFEGLWQ